MSKQLWLAHHLAPEVPDSEPDVSLDQEDKYNTHGSNIKYNFAQETTDHSTIDP
jgi:hypothetical protein